MVFQLYSVPSYKLLYGFGMGQANGYPVTAIRFRPSFSFSLFVIVHGLIFLFERCGTAIPSLGVWRFAFPQSLCAVLQLSCNAFCFEDAEGNLSYWHLTTGKLMYSIRESSVSEPSGEEEEGQGRKKANQIFSIDYSPDGKTLATAGSDMIVCANFTFSTSNCLYSFLLFNLFVVCCLFWLASDPNLRRTHQNEHNQTE